MNLLMLSGDSSVARGYESAFYQMLARFSQHWQRIDIITPTAADATPRTIHGNVYVHPSPMHRALQPLFIRRHGHQLLQERRYDLITSHDYGFFYNAMGLWWLLRHHDIPYVSEIHHIEGHPIATTLRERLWLRAAHWYIPRAAKRAAAFRVVNPDVGDYLRALGVPRRNILHLPSLYLDMSLFHPLPDVEKRYDVLFVGRLVANKGIPILLDALVDVVQTHPTITLGILGDGPLRSTIEQAIEAHHLQENIIFIPRLAHASDVARLYNQARMLVCASTVEGGPRVTGEAMACGVPVISTPVGIMPSLIEHGINGLLFRWSAPELAHHMRRLLDDEGLRQALGSAGCEAVQRYEAGRLIDDYAQAYHNLIIQLQHS